MNDNNNPDPDAEISPLKIDVKGYFKNKIVNYQLIKLYSAQYLLLMV